MRSLVFAMVATIMAFAQTPPLTVIQQVKKAALDGDFVAAQAALDQYKKAKGTTPEYLEAWSWISRGQLAKKNYDGANTAAEAVRKACLAELSHRKVDDDKNFPIARAPPSKYRPRRLRHRADATKPYSFCGQK